jgi:glucokinase
MFCAVLGGFAGNVALTTQPEAVLISPAESRHALSITWRLPSSGRVFEQKGHFRAYLEAIPSRKIIKFGGHVPRIEIARRIQSASRLIEICAVRGTRR